MKIEFIPERNLNPPHISAICSDKWVQKGMFQMMGLAIPKTSLNPDLGFPCVAKPRKGSKGQGIHMVNNLEETQTLLGYLFQEYIFPLKRNGNPLDFRIFLQSRPEKIVTGYARLGVKGMLTTNLSKGAEPIPLIETLKELGVRQDIFSEIISVIEDIFEGYIELGLDFMLSEEKMPYLIEINSMPGIKGFFILSDKEKAAFPGKTGPNQITLNKILDNRMKLIGEQRCAE